MKILYVMATNGGIGGLEQHTLQLCNGLAQQHEIHLIADVSYADQLHANVTLHAVDFSRSRFNPFLIYQLIKKVQQIQPDILHVQASKAASLFAPWLNCFHCKKVVTVHGMKSNLKPFMAFDQIIAVSGKIKQKFPAHAPVQVIWNGITAAVDLKVAQTSQQRICAIAIGRLETVKGFDVLIEAWQGIDADLIIVGDGSQRAVLEQKIKQLNLSQNVQLLGFRSDIANLLAAADCMIISSLKEGGPITLAEALLNQTPVLATDVGMVPDFIDPTYICVANNVSALHQLIQTQLKPKAQMSSVFEPSFLKAKQSLTLEQMLNQTQRLYAELLV